MKLLSPAKVNLSLQILKKRSDGYHEIHTVFERVGLFDRVELRSLKTAGICIETDSKEVPAGPGNLVYKAARLLKERFKISSGVVIRLKKVIPVSAGLGGGSSNAATVLLGLNRLWRLGLTRAHLVKIGAELGSDVPFFILESPFALGTGRGEVLRKISPAKARLWHVLVKPPFRISTREAYKGLKPRMLTPRKTDVRMLVQSIEKGRSRAIGQLLVNSLELSINKRVRTVSNLKKKLLVCGAHGALMSGSGSAVFGLFDTKSRAEAAARILRKNKRLRVFVAATY